METSRDNYELALSGAALGLRFIPCRPGTKVPLVKWKPFQTESPTPEMYEKWFKDTRNNITVITNDMVLFDAEDVTGANVVLGECGDTPWKVKTPRGGMHLGYRKRKGVEVNNAVKIRGMDIDIRTDGGLEVLPYSTTENGAYAWAGGGILAVEDLPVAKLGWSRKRERKRARSSLVIEDSGDRLLYRARLYMARIEPAVSGQGGHRKTFATACRMARFVNYDADMLWVLLLEYSARCLPPWSDQELRHKWEDALKTRS